MVSSMLSPASCMHKFNQTYILRIVNIRLEIPSSCTPVFIGGLISSNDDIRRCLILYFCLQDRYGSRGTVLIDLSKSIGDCDIEYRNEFLFGQVCGG